MGDKLINLSGEIVEVHAQLAATQTWATRPHSCMHF